MSNDLKQLSSNKCFGGHIRKYEHDSNTLGLKAKFNIFIPKDASESSRVHTLYWLSGLTCTEDNFIQKAGAQREAARQNLAMVTPDTSPRGTDIEDGDAVGWDFGAGAGFYVDATADGWNKNYKMYSYVTKELPALIEANFPVSDKKSVFGHSMGGHGALVAYLKNPGLYQSVSAFSPICNPMECPWGQKAFKGYLGDEEKAWKEYDATHLVGSYTGSKTDILIDQGSDDNFLHAKQLLPDNFQKACQEADHPLNLRFQEGYDHSYFFISSFVDEHIKHHALSLNGHT